MLELLIVVRWGVVSMISESFTIFSSVFSKDYVYSLLQTTA